MFVSQIPLILLLFIGDEEKNSPGDLKSSGELLIAQSSLLEATLFFPNGNSSGSPGSADFVEFGFKSRNINFNNSFQDIQNRWKFLF